MPQSRIIHKIPGARDPMAGSGLKFCSECGRHRFGRHPEHNREDKEQNGNGKKPQSEKESEGGV